MKTSVVAAFAVTLLAAGPAFTQDNASSTTPGQTTAVTAKPLTVAGTVSDDRMTLVTDIDSEWAVSNPDALKGHEGHRVTIKCYVDTVKNKLQVLSVKKDANETAYAAVGRFDRR